MNWVVIATLFAGTLVIASARLCSVSDDCKRTQCCAVMSMSHLLRKGVCWRIRKLGERCIEETHNNKYIMGCPCEEGLVCKPKNPRVTKEHPKYYDKLRCRVESTTPEPVETDTPEPVNTDTPEPVETDTPEPVDTDTPEPVETDTPEPVEI